MELRVEAADCAFRINRQHLARLDVTLEGGSDKVERTGFAADHIAVTDASERKRTVAVFVAAYVETVRGHHKKCKSALYHVQGTLDGKEPFVVAVHRAFLDKVCDDFAVGC